MDTVRRWACAAAICSLLSLLCLDPVLGESTEEVQSAEDDAVVAGSKQEELGPMVQSTPNNGKSTGWVMQNRCGGLYGSGWAWLIFIFLPVQCLDRGWTGTKIGLHKVVVGGRGWGWVLKANALKESGPGWRTQRKAKDSSLWNVVVNDQQPTRRGNWWHDEGCGLKCYDFVLFTEMLNVPP